MAFRGRQSFRSTAMLDMGREAHLIRCANCVRKAPCCRGLLLAEESNAMESFLPSKMAGRKGFRKAVDKWLGKSGMLNESASQQ